MSGTPFVSPGALHQMVTGPAPPVVLDATLLLPKPRFDGDFRSHSGRPQWVRAHIPGSVHVEVDAELSVPDATHDRHPPPQVLADALAQLGIGARTTVVVYDGTGGLWAARVWFLLRWIGVPVHVLDGGFAGWQSLGMPVETGPGPERPPAPPWQAHPTYDAWIDESDIRGGPADNLVCGLSPAAFSGSEPTRYSRRGHIPGSVNVPARSLFDDAGFIRSKAEIAQRYRAAGVDLGSEVLLYCGGGISAAANALALSHIGIRHVRIYDGSLEEWSANPALPLVTT